MTGTYVGFGCMLGTSHYPPRFIPSFTFLTDHGPQPYRMEKMIEMVKHVFIRRGLGGDEILMRRNPFAQQPLMN